MISPPLPPPAIQARTKGIQSVEIGFRVIRALVDAGGALALKQIAAASAMSPSKTRMYLVSLIRVGLIAQADDTGLYALGAYAAELGSVARQRTDLLSAVQPVMDELARVTGARMLLAAWGHGGVTLLRQTDGAEALPIDFRIGGHVSLTRTATGHVCLAYLPHALTDQLREADIAENRRNPDLRFLNASYLDGVARTVRANATATVRDVRLGSGVVLVGYTAVAAPVFDHAGTLRLVLTVLHPKRRPKLGLPAARNLLREAAQRLSGLDHAPLRVVR